MIILKTGFDFAELSKGFFFMQISLVFLAPEDFQTSCLYFSLLLNEEKSHLDHKLTKFQCTYATRTILVFYDLCNPTFLCGICGHFLEEFSIYYILKKQKQNSSERMSIIFIVVHVHSAQSQ